MSLKLKEVKFGLDTDTSKHEYMRDKQTHASTHTCTHTHKLRESSNIDG